ncbi:hypothetical protein DFJ73DRAFT_516537 [Zopfochytrium polystomum]|nr:hypothetical protein DFJ73DRAFT_516537 [Zopfochytrium polystomum]
MAPSAVPTAPVAAAAAAPGLSAFHAVVIALLALVAGMQLQSNSGPSPTTSLSQFFSQLSAPATPHHAASTHRSSSGRPPFNSSGARHGSGAAEIAPSTDEHPSAPAYFTHDDFLTYFGVDLLHTQMVDPTIEKYILAHDVLTDQSYTNDRATNDRWRQQLGWVFGGGLADDKRFYIKWISAQKGYGVFSKVHVGNGHVVSHYTGVVTNGSASDYMWGYPSVIYDDYGVQLNLGIDSRFRGNWARFVNHDQTPNCDAIYVPYNNMWNVIYVANRPIAPGEEVTVSYGDGYWQSRPDKLA